MSYIRHQECVLEINGTKLLGLDAQVSASSSVAENRVYGGKMLGYEAVSPLDAGLSFKYYVTGKKDIISSLTGMKPCSGKFCGISFSGAYLTNYSVDIEPYRPITFGASFVIHSGYKNETSTGSFEGITSGLANGAFSEVRNFNKNNIGLDFPNKISYSIDCERIPNYVIGHEYPQDVRLGTVYKRFSIAGENIGNFIEFSGRDFAKISTQPKNRDGITRGEELNCFGRITSQDLSVSKNNMMQGQIEVMESVR